MVLLDRTGRGNGGHGKCDIRVDSDGKCDIREDSDGKCDIRVDTNFTEDPTFCSYCIFLTLCFKSIFNFCASVTTAIIP